MQPKAAEEPEVDVQQVASLPLVEEVLADGPDIVQPLSVERVCARGEPALG